LPSCTDIVAALNTLAEATTDPNVINDLTGQTAVLDNLSASTAAIVQLTAGGDAILTVPSGFNVDGKMFRLTVAGKVHATHTSTILTYSVNANDTPFPGYTVASANSNHLTDISFFVIADCLWDSTTQVLRGGVQYSDFTSAGNVVFGNFQVTGVTAQSDIQFVVTGEINPQPPNPSPDATDSFTVTQFKLELI